MREGKSRLERKIRAHRLIARATMIEGLEDRRLLAAIATDQADYSFGSIAVITGTGFLPGETIRLQVLHQEGTFGSNDDPQNQAWKVTDGGAGDFDGLVDGNITTSWVVDDPDAVGATYVLSAVGLNSGETAVTTFTDARTINSASVVNGTNVLPGASISATVSVTTDGNGANTRWRSTRWSIGTSVPSNWSSATLVDHANHDSSGTFNETFNITAPTSSGSYNVYFQAYSDDAGTGLPSAVYTLANAVSVLDVVAPSTSASFSGTAGNNGWYKSNVQVTLSATDAGSGVASTWYRLGGSGSFSQYTAPFNITTEATNTLEFYSVDVANNTETTKSQTVKIDKTAPTINAQRDTAANANGWNNTDVASSYSASDSLAGLADPATGNFTFTSEGAGQSHMFTVTDLAGNSASATVSGVNIDKTAPTLSASNIIVNGADGGGAQRSMVRSMTVSFSEPVAYGTAATPFVLTNLSGVPIAGVDLDISVAADTLSQTFIIRFKTGGNLLASLADGRYQFKVNQSAFSDQASNALGTGEVGQSFHRFFGDSDGDADVDSLDVSRLRTSLNKISSQAGYLWYFDSEGDGDVDAIDNAAQRLNFTKKLP